MSEVTFDAANFSEQYEDYKTISWPETQTVYNGLIAAGVAVASFYVVKGIIAIAASIPSGGTSLLLLCF